MVYNARYSDSGNSVEYGRSLKGLTLVELLVALMISAIVFGAVAALAFAMGTAHASTSDRSEKQAYVRYATLRISELIRQCKLVCGTPGGDLSLWRADDNGDGKININELVIVERGTGRNILRFCEFDSSQTEAVSLSGMGSFAADSHSPRRVTVIPQCTNVEFLLDTAAPATKLVSIRFDVIEDGVGHHYEVNAALRGRAGNLVSGGEIVSGDDD